MKQTIINFLYAIIAACIAIIAACIRGGAIAGAADAARDARDVDDRDWLRP